ncbi:hypothetical protein AVEN_42079-1 [Araneus ventricosus]|uniref:Uncharacterized protein n=1 Tax=Araneus ventricosus TaxID=182803 RepID=A0A4Y2VA49_ARAVE|nr:hypothetical protein AVEN_218926-1 [Araneus ventricosus]GBO22172.1 hypothetical protein AVEN_42079-1 [Araneus ventricosus]
MGRKWVRAVIYSTTQRQHSPGNRLDVLGTPDPELVNQGHAMSKHSRACSHHSLHISDPHWATPTTTPMGSHTIKTNPSGLRHINTDPYGPTETSTRASCQHGLPNISHQYHPYTAVSPNVLRPKNFRRLISARAK